MRNNKGISMITLIITIIVMIILAAIAFMAAGDQVGSAQFSKFATEFGEYATNFANAPVAEVTEGLGLTGKASNQAQKIYAAARDIDLKNFDAVLNGIIVPGGYTSPRFQNDIKDSTGAKVELASATTPVYEIKDGVMQEYAGAKFYGDANGKETHWVTAKGTVFTLPGYPRVVDGEERMYITPDLYYVSDSTGEMITANDLIPIQPQKVGGDVVTGSQTVADAADNVAEGAGGQEGATDKFTTVKAGDYVAYTPDTGESVSWRVWAVNGNEVLIIPTAPVGSLRLGPAATTTNFDQKMNESLAAYNTAEEDIKEACKAYTSSALGVTRDNIRSLTIDDLELAAVSDLKTQKVSYSASGTPYNETKICKSDSYHAARYNEATGENEISPTFIAASKTSTLTVKQTYYKSTAPGWKPLGESSTETYGDLLGTTYSWLPLACVDCTRDGANYLIQRVCSNGLDSTAIVSSFGGCRAMTHGVRPIVSLNASTLTVDSTNSGDGSASSPWNIVKK